MELLEYITEDGRVPFREWLNDLRDTKVQARIEARLNRIRLGNLGDYRSVGQGVSELRIMVGPGYRIYFGRTGSTIVVLLCAGDKDSQPRDINLAKRYWEDYLRRSR